MPRIFWVLISAAVIAVIAVGVIVYKFDPYKSSSLVFALLFVSCFIFLSGLTIPGAYFYELKRGVLELNHLFWASIKRGLILSSTPTVILLLQTLHVLTWWNGLLVLLIAVIVDMYFRK
ncbi:hypothetical protein JXA59_01120 [Patescibacteria group bacterium]|nr:hypothetical protein [Patescibacteria group bacterium]